MLMIIVRKLELFRATFRKSYLALFTRVHTVHVFVCELDRSITCQPTDQRFPKLVTHVSSIYSALKAPEPESKELMDYHDLPINLQSLTR